MAAKSIIVSGEASETDSDEENPKTPTKFATKVGSIQGALITGEDSESDSEPSKQSKAESVTSNITLINNDCDSLLHRKLRESNRDIYRGLDGFFQSAVNDAGNTLNTTEQHLLRSQITLQNALTSLKSLNTHSLGVRNRLKNVLAANFLPNLSTE